jgi:hypothetical protein
MSATGWAWCWEHFWLVDMFYINHGTTRPNIGLVLLKCPARGFLVTFDSAISKMLGKSNSWSKGPARKQRVGKTGQALPDSSSAGYPLDQCLYERLGFNCNKEYNISRFKVKIPETALIKFIVVIRPGLEAMPLLC